MLVRRWTVFVLMFHPLNVGSWKLNVESSLPFQDKLPPLVVCPQFRQNQCALDPHFPSGYAAVQVANLPCGQGCYSVIFRTMTIVKIPLGDKKNAEFPYRSAMTLPRTGNCSNLDCNVPGGRKPCFAGRAGVTPVEIRKWFWWRPLRASSAGAESL